MEDFKAMLDALNTEGIEVDEGLESQPEALKGQYSTEVKKVFVNDKKDWESGEVIPGKNISFSLQVTETFSGNKGDKRYLTKRHDVFCENVYGDRVVTKADNLRTFLATIKAMGIYNEQMTFASEGELLSFVEANAPGKMLKVSTWPQMDGGEVKRDAKGWPKQNVKVVKGFTPVPEEEVKAQASASGASPF